jgi:hypothetical protein
MKTYKLKNMVGRTYYECATTRKKAVDQLTSKIREYVYIVDDIKLNYERNNLANLVNNDF